MWRPRWYPLTAKAPRVSPTARVINRTRPATIETERPRGSDGSGICGSIRHLPGAALNSSTGAGSSRPRRPTTRVLALGLRRCGPYRRRTRPARHAPRWLREDRGGRKTLGFSATAQPSEWAVGVGEVATANRRRFQTNRLCPPAVFRDADGEERRWRLCARSGRGGDRSRRHGRLPGDVYSIVTLVAIPAAT